MKIAIGCDHGALDLKNAVIAHLQAKNYEVVNFGTDTLASCDYPDFVAPAAKAVADGTCDKGIVLCTTGIGASIVANKVDGVRCALLSDLMSARRATSVFPYPTSPQISRSIIRLLSISRFVSSMAAS